MPATVAIVDSGGANIASLMFAFERLRACAKLTTDPAEIRNAGSVVLPGVGTARDAMARLRARGLVDVIRNLTQPVLGVCLGMQLLAEASEEDDVDCLGILPGVVQRLDASPEMPVPNMGWCRVNVRRQHPLLDGIADGAWFYFLHSYALPAGADTLALARHCRPFSAIVQRGNFVATQFHPERSSAAGATLLRNFIGTAG